MNKTTTRIRNHFTPARIALLFAVFTALWSVTSNYLLTFAHINDDPLLHYRIEVIQGLIFATISSGVLFLLLQGWRKLSDAASPEPEQASPVNTSRLALVFVALGLLVPLIGFSIVKMHSPELTRSAYANLVAVAHLQAKHIESWLAERNNECREILSDEQLAAQIDHFMYQQSPGKSSRSILYKFDYLRTAHGYDTILLLDDSGQALLQSGIKTEVPPALRNLLHQSLSGKMPRHGEFYHDDSGLVHLDWVVPIAAHTHTGNPTAVAVALRTSTNKHFDPLIRFWPSVSHSKETFLVRRDGESVVFLNEPRQRKTAALMLRHPVKDISLPAAIAVQSTKPGIMEGKNYRGVPVLAAYRPVAGSDWKIVTEIDQAEVLAPLYDLAYWASLITFTATIALGIALVLMWRQQRRINDMALLAEKQKSDRLLRQFFDLPFIGMTIVSPETKRFVKFNDHLCEIFGYSREELTEKNWEEITHPDDLDKSIVAVGRVMRGEVDGYVLDTRYIRKDGTVVFAILDNRCMRKPDGTVDFFVCTIQDITERMQGQATLLESEERYRTLFTNAQDGILILDKNGKVVAVNDSFAKMHGYTISEMLEMNLKDLDAPDTLRQAQERMRRMFAGESLTFEVEHYHKNGNVFPLEVSAGMISLDGEAFLQAFHRDISARKQLEEKLLQSETKFRTLFESSSDAIMLFDESGYFDCNLATLRIFRYSSLDDILHAHPFTLSPPTQPGGQNSYSLANEIIARTLKTGNTRFEWVHRRSDDSEFLCEINLTAMNMGGRQVLEATVHDITDRKQAEAARDVLYNEKLLLLESTGEGIYGMDTDGRFTFVNGAAALMLGYSVQEMLGQKIHELIHYLHADGSPYPVANCPIIQVLTSGQSCAHETEVFWRKDGTALPVEYASHPVVDAGKITGAVVTFSDITERRKAASALQQLNEELEVRVEARTHDLELARIAAEQANKAKSAFLATMSHEIRTPMNGVIGMLEVLQQSSLDNHQTEVVDIIHESAFSLLSIIDDILDLSKIESGKLHLEQTNVNVSDVVDSVGEALHLMAVKKGVELRIFIDPTMPKEIMGDPGRLRQILINLVGNAIKFSSGLARPGQVSLRALLVKQEPEHATLKFQVADNGIGMDASLMEQLFSPFTQADTSTTRRHGGTGLGLAICQQLTTLIGGEIKVQSTLGEGSTFTVHLPCSLPSKKLDLPPPSQVSALSCLIVGSEQGLADDLATYLAHAAAEVDRVQDIMAAQEWIVNRAPGLSVVVIETPGTALLPLTELRNVARMRPGRDIRFVVLGRGERRHCRVEAEDLVMLDSGLVLQRAFLNAVALAAGRIKEDMLVPLHSEIKPFCSPSTREDARRQGRLILIAEDSEINQRVILHQLRLLGFAADIAGNGREALKLWQSGDYALLLTDLRMPEMDGFTLTESIRASESGHDHIPILALTANALKGEVEHCRAIGMDDYLTKPVQLARLKAALYQWLPAAEPATETGDSPLFDSPLDRRLPPVSVDVNVLKALVGDDAAVIDMFLRKFRETAAKAAVEVSAAWATGKTEKIAAAAHKLKSSARSVGALALSELCSHIEKVAKAGDKEALAVLLYGFETEMAAVKNHLGTLLE